MTSQPLYKILLVDDDPQVLEVLKELFCDEYDVIVASSGAESVVIVESTPEIATAVLDIKMSDMDGIATGRAIREIDSSIPIIFHTGYPGDYEEDDIERDEHPYDFVQKGRSSTRLMRSVHNAVESWANGRAGRSLIEQAESVYGMIGRSKGMVEVFRLIGKVGPSDSKVMILGETGTGKELVARAIHTLSSRRNEHLAIFNCNHKAPDLVESELFGHTRGAFTGAATDRMGLFEYANCGTVFLDEIGDLDITTQAKLLRVLETGEYQKIGSPDERRTDVRVLCATHKDLQQMVSEGSFREDLYFRLKGVRIVIPPLRQRREDIPVLVRKFTDRFTIERDSAPRIFDTSAMNILIEADWPGNVRQLQDTIQSLIVLSDSELIIADDVRNYLDIDQSAHGAGLSERLRELERTLIIEALCETGYNITAAALLLEIERATLSKKIKSHGLDVRQMKSEA